MLVMCANKFVNAYTFVNLIWLSYEDDIGLDAELSFEDRYCCNYREDAQRSGKHLVQNILDHI